MGKSDERHSLGGVQLDTGPEHLEEAWNDVDPARDRRWSERMRSSVVPGESFEKATMTRSTPSESTISGRWSGVPRTPGDRATVGVRRIGIDEAEDVQTVLRMAGELQGDAPTDLAGADDDRVLDVRAASAARRPRDGPTDRDQDRRGEPEGQETRDRRVGDAG